MTWEGLGIFLEELEEALGERESWLSLTSLDQQKKDVACYDVIFRTSDLLIIHHDYYHCCCCLPKRRFCSSQRLSVGQDSSPSLLGGGTRRLLPASS